MRWTSEQQRVISERHRNMLVSAAAGSGKTAVLTERIISLLREGVDIRSLLVITFTNASAADMKEKIRRALSKDPSLSNSLRKLSAASISTFHAFCNQLIRDHFMVLGIDPHYTLLEPTELHLLEQEILTELLEERFEKAPADFLDLAEAYGDDKTLKHLKQLIIQVKNYLSNRVDEEETIQLILENYEDKAYWKRRTEEYIEDQVELIRDFYEQAIDLVGPGRIALLDQELEMTASISSMVFNRFPLLKKAEKEDADFVDRRNQAKALRDEAKKRVQKLQEQLEELGDFDENFEVFRSLKSRVQTLLELTLAFLERYREYALEEGLFSFSDLEYYALKLLKDPRVRESYVDKFDYIFIDEYQDTSPIQEAIVSQIARENNLFMVGDIKQSIYRFRRADPSIFLDKFNRYKPDAPEDSLDLRVDLNRNFRSSPPVIDGINKIFKMIMRDDFGGITYTKDHELVFGNESLKDIDQEIEFMLSTGDDPVQAEVDAMVTAIHQFIRQGYRYKDIVILSRSIKGYTRTIEKSFREEGIPLHLSTSDIYLTSLEVELMINYLRVIDNSRQDLPLLSLLRLPRYGLSDDDLLEVRYHYPKDSYYDALMRYDVPGDLYDRLQFFLAEIKQFRVESRYLSQDELLQRIYSETDFEGFILGLHSAKSRIANLRKLFLTAGDYERRKSSSLSEFLLYVEELISEEKDFEAAKTIGEDSDAVRMMTIHKSKGLQFPVVILAGLHKRYNEPDGKGTILTHEDYLLTDIIDLEKREKYPPFFKRILQQDILDQGRQEELRVLYVALTRAQEKLLLSGYVNDDYYADAKRFSLSALRGANSYLKLIELSGIFNQVGSGFNFFKEDQKPEEVRQKKTRARGYQLKRPELEEVTTQSKRSVSQLVKEEVMIPPIRRSDEPQEEGGRTRGTLFHKAMEWVDFSDVEGSLERLEELGVLRDFQDRELVLNYMKSETLRDLIKRSLRIEREVPFVWKARRQGEEQLVQGVIDQVMVLEDGVVIVDFKSDNSFHYVESYKRQVQLYSEAYEDITGRKVLSKLIWFARLGEILEV